MGAALVQLKDDPTESVTLYVPASANTWLGFCTLLNGEPSPKSHVQLFTVPELGTDKSVKFTTLVSQDGVEKLKFGVGNAYTVIVPVSTGLTHGPVVVTV